jgi:hypothetical protein
MVKRALIDATALALLAVALAIVLLRSHDNERRAPQAALPKTYQQLVAENYKVLHPRQTRRLLHFADAFHACMVAHIPLGAPRALPTRILMKVPAGTAVAKSSASPRAAEPPSATRRRGRPSCSGST